MSALKAMRAETESISRGVFLLSAEEICASAPNLIAHEGRALWYFRSASSKLLTYEDGTTATWFTRTPALSERVAVIAISDEGVVGLAPVSSAVGSARCGIRPAFRLPSDTPVTTRLLNGDEVYILDTTR